MKTLYPYQREDVEKLKDLPYGLIASEMGTGKSYEGIALAVEWIKQVLEGTGQLLPTLVICPINTFSSWHEKFKEQILSNYNIDNSSEPETIKKGGRQKVLGNGKSLIDNKDAFVNALLLAFIVELFGLTIFNLFLFRII